MVYYKWTKENIEKLIEEYEKHEILWDTNSPDFKNKKKKQETLVKVASEFDCTADELFRKLHNMRNQVSQELRKMKMKKKNSDEYYVSKWPYLESLKFLRPILMPKIKQPTTSTERSVDLSEMGESQSELSRYGDITAIDDRQYEYLQESSESEVEPPAKKLKTTSNESTKEKLILSVMETLNKQQDDDDRFGQYVGMELRGLQSELNKRRLKSEIRKAIIRIVDEEDILYAPDGCNGQHVYDAVTVKTENV